MTLDPLQAFVEHGCLRLRRIEHFANLEHDPRADGTEGVGHQRLERDVPTIRVYSDGSADIARKPRLVDSSIEHLNPIFIYCFSYPPGGDVSQLPRRFGSATVQIDDPRRLAQELTIALTHEGALRGTPVVECCEVTYSKGEVSEYIADHRERVRLSYAQRPPRFADECEYRFVVKATPTIELPMYHDICIGPLPYARILPRAG